MSPPSENAPKDRSDPFFLRGIRILFGEARRAVRSVEPVQILACAILGIIVGVAVLLLRNGVLFLHEFLFSIPSGSFLSAGIGVAPLAIAVVPLLGGLLLGLAYHVRRRLRGNVAGELVDPIEANALYGGRLSFRDSVWLTFTTFLSNASGASLGMEAGYTQLGAATYSLFGQYTRLRRADLRVFVTSGAAAAIAAAFNAPLAGAFYGYELILGSYNVRALAPVVVASVCAALTVRSVGHMQAIFEVSASLHSTSESTYLLFVLLGLGAALVAIATMQSVTWTERAMRHLPFPEWTRPAVGGLMISVIALYAPQVLGSGHGAVQMHFDTRSSLLLLAILLVMKLWASAISLGSGFRGGLFSSSLFLGVLFGALFAQAAAAIVPSLEPDHAAFMLAGMGAVAAAIIGAPFTMVFLVLEGTGDFPVAIGVVIAVTVAATLVRITFGYSFATWRFHLRGLGIKGAHDIGWISDLTVGRLMRADPKRAQEDVTLAGLRKLFPVGSTKRIYVFDKASRYIGSIDISDLHDGEIDDIVERTIAADLAMGRQNFLLPGENIRTALSRLEAVQAEELPVLDSQAGGKVIGYLTEAYALKRYTLELERMRGADLGENDLFSIGPLPGR